MNEYIGIVLIKSYIKANEKDISTLRSLKLKKINSFVLAKATDSLIGKARAVRKYVSWSLLNEDQVNLLKDRKLISNIPYFKAFNSPYRSLDRKENLGRNKYFLDFILSKYFLRSSYRKTANVV